MAPTHPKDKDWCKCAREGNIEGKCDPVPWDPDEVPWDPDGLKWEHHFNTCQFGSHNTDCTAEPEANTTVPKPECEYYEAWTKWKACEVYMREFYDGLSSETVGMGALPGVGTLKYKEIGPTYLARFFLFTIFLSAASYTFARVALHFLTLKGSMLCECCLPKKRDGSRRFCGGAPILRAFMIKILKIGGPVSLNSLMIVNTKLVWNEGGEPAAQESNFYPDDTPSNVFGYSVGFGQIELIFFFINVVLMMLFILTVLFVMALPVLIAPLIRICCKKKMGKALFGVPRSTCRTPWSQPPLRPTPGLTALSVRLSLAARPRPRHHRPLRSRAFRPFDYGRHRRARVR